MSPADTAKERINALLTPEDHATLSKALTECQALSQAIGALGPRLRRTKPGTKKHKKYWDDLTKMENERYEHSDKIRFFLGTGLVL
jgi:hypothetical protein